MKRIIALFISITITLSIPFGTAASFVRPSENQTSLNYYSLTLTDFINLSSHDFSSLTNKKMSMWDKISFEVTKMKMKKLAKKEPALLVSEYYSRGMNKKLATGWWVLIGVVVLAFVILVLLAIAIGKINHTG